jgi:hypothetical protein
VIVDIFLYCGIGTSTCFGIVILVGVGFFCIVVVNVFVYCGSGKSTCFSNVVLA